VWIWSTDSNVYVSSHGPELIARTSSTLVSPTNARTEFAIHQAITWTFHAVASLVTRDVCAMRT
jgi:hypothetical protein